MVDYIGPGRVIKGGQNRDTRIVERPPAPSPTVNEDVIRKSGRHFCYLADISIHMSRKDS